MCPQPDHMSAVVTVDDFIMGYVQAGRACSKCAHARKYNHVRPGEIFATTLAPSSASERALIDALDKFFHLAMPGTNALMFAEEFMGQPWGRPDIIIPGLRVVVEFDGSGIPNIENGHDSEDGQLVDELKDHLTRNVGWEAVRIRTGGMPALGPFDVGTGETVGTPAGEIASIVASAVIRAAVELGTLDDHLDSLKEPALLLLADGF
ncbi:hypothetical protein [Arthrobacter sp. HLT1-21]